MTQGKRANERLDILLKKLGLHEWRDDVSFYRHVYPMGYEKGILHEISDHQQEQLNVVNDLLAALFDYLGVVTEVPELPKVKVVIKPKKTNTPKSTTKRKYVKSGKYSKKAK